MFDIGWSELVVIGVVALIAIGPKELPGVLRTVGQYMGKIRRMASEFQGQFNEAMREAEMADIKKSVDEMTDAAKGFTNFDPVESVKSGFEAATSDAPKPDASAAPGYASPEHVSPVPVTPAAAAAEMPAAVAPDVSIPQPEAAGADLAIAPEAPQPVAPELSPETKKAGSGA